MVAGVVLTNNDRDYSGRLDQHPYAPLLAMEGIEH
jgi:hypothetical protein